MTVFTWRVDRIAVKDVGDTKDVVGQVAFTVTGVDGIYSAQRSYNVDLLPHDPDDFTELSELKEDQVIGWVKDALNAPGKVGADTVEQEVDEAIQTKKKVAPRVVDLPWRKG